MTFAEQGPVTAELGWPDGLGLPDHDYVVDVGPLWLQASHRATWAELPEQGWKLHVSARPGTCEATLRTALPVLRRHETTFKVARSPEVLRALNDGQYGLAAIGKFLTAYPRVEAVVALGRDLASALAGYGGPRILSDRRVAPDAPVFYRYGPFSPRFMISASGSRALAMRGPDGEDVAGAALAHYVPLDWAPDPFRPAADQRVADNRPIVLGDHYAVESVISRSPRGAVYRAVDQRDGSRVVVKHARAYLNESARGDARTYLRAERRALLQLAEIPSIPVALDWFRSGDDDYLVLSDLGGADLRFNVLEHGLYAPDDGRRSVRGLAVALLAVLDRIHDRGIVVRDLAPKNVLILPGDVIGLVDFELSAVQGRAEFGWSPGYSTAGQREHQLPVPEDDFYSLGATLFHALTGLDPFVHADGSVNLAATLDCLSEVVGRGSDTGRLVAGLMADDPAVRVRTAAAIRRRLPITGPSVPPRPPTADAGETLGRVRELAAGVAADLLGQFDRGPGLDLSVQSGAAGLLAELAYHPEALPVASQLARALSDAAGEAPMEPGLMFGRTGVAAALHAAGAATDDHELCAAAAHLLPTAEELAALEQLDVARGLAGVLLGAVAIGATELIEAAAAMLTAGESRWPEQAALLPSSRPGHAIAIAQGCAHGAAGVVLAHLQWVVGVDRGAVAPATLDRLMDLARAGERLSEAARRPTARPMAASWCQGLAGIGAVLVRGAQVVGDVELLDAARACADAAVPIALRSPSLSQCCGIAGVGELAIDLAVATGDDRYLDTARHLLEVIAQRTDLAAAEAPEVPSALGWGDGLAGVLAFARRLDRPATPRHWMGAPLRPTARLGPAAAASGC